MDNQDLPIENFPAGQGDTPWARLLETVEERLLESRIALYPNVQEFAEKLLGTDNDPVDPMNLLHLAENSIFMDDGEIQGILRWVQQVNEDDPAFDGHHVYYYVRSITLGRQEFAEVVNHYEHLYPADGDLVRNMRMYAGDETYRGPLHIRYVGCTSEDTPLGRHHADIGAQVHYNRFGNFHRCLHEVLPAREFLVYHVPSLSVPGTTADIETKYEVDGTEQFLIHLFGRSRLLNSQPGGYYRGYVPFEDDVQCMNGAGELQNIRRYLFNEHQAGEQFELPDLDLAVERRDNIRNVFRNAYQVQLPLQDNVASSLITRSHVTMFTNQACPAMDRFLQYQFGDQEETLATPFVIFAKDITRDDFSTQRQFFDHSRAGDITQNLITQALRLDHPPPYFKAPCFHDLWPCPPRSHRRRELIAPEILVSTSGRIMEQLGPLLIVTMGFAPTSVAYSNFQGGGYSMANYEYKGLIGEPQIIDYDYDYDAEAEEHEAPRNKTIMIAHLDPGYVSYGSADPVILRLMYLTWCRTLLLADVLIDIIQNEVEFLHASPGTEGFCQYVLHRLQQREAHTCLRTHLRDARREAQELSSRNVAARAEGYLIRTEVEGLPDPGIGGMTPAEFGSMSLAARKQRFGDTVADRNSPGRRAQRRALERLRYPELRALPSFTTNPGAWAQWFDNLPQGISVLQAVVGRTAVERTETLPGLTQGQTRIINTRVPAPQGWPAGDDSWKLDREVAHAALCQFMNDLRANTPPMSSQEARRRGQLGIRTRFGGAFIDYFLRKKVLVNSNGKINMCAYIDNDFVDYRATAEGVFVGKQYAGEKYLDLDPNVCDHALVLKTGTDVDELHVAEPLKLIYDWYLLLYARESYFISFERTLAHLQIPMRPFVQEEAAREEHEQFTWSRIFNLFLMQYAPTMGQVYRFATKPNQRGYVNIYTLLREIATTAGNAFETFIWTEYIDNMQKRASLTTALKKLGEQLNFTWTTEKQSYMEGRHQRYYVAITIRREQHGQ